MTKLFRFGFVRQQIESFLKVYNPYIRKTGMEESSLEQAIFKPPSSVRGMVELDRNAFKKQVEIPTILVPVKSLGKFMKIFKNYTFKNRGAKLVDNGNGDEDSTSRFITMKPDFEFEKIHPEKVEKLKELNIEETLHKKQLVVGYEQYRHNEILGAILPEGLDSTSGFERVGHIIHVNLHEHQRPYKHIIGQVLIDTHKMIRTVVDKSCIIDNTYRNFEMEIIGGEENYVTKVIEYGRTFEFDFSKVFWNSRLQTEHRRIYDAIPEGSTVFDVFAGVGPFSIPLAKKGCKVYANDLNAESHKWLCHNAKLNKTKIEAFNMDGREFIRACLPKYLRSNPHAVTKIFVVMNLPGYAIDFLDAFAGLYTLEDPSSPTNSDEKELDDNLPTIHVFCYVFSSAEDRLDDVRRRAARSLGAILPEEHTIREVRKVSPSKEQYCLSFDVLKSVLLTPLKNRTSDELEPQQKRQKLSKSEAVS